MGAGGGGGAFVRESYAASDLPATVSVTIGAGGTAGVPGAAGAAGAVDDGAPPAPVAAAGAVEGMTPGAGMAAEAPAAAEPPTETAQPQQGETAPARRRTAKKRGAFATSW